MTKRILDFALPFLDVLGVRGVVWAAANYWATDSISKYSGEFGAYVPVGIGLVFAVTTGVLIASYAYRPPTERATALMNGHNKVENKESGS